MSSFILSQFLVALALGTNLLSFQFKERKKVITCLIVSCSFISLHFALLEVWTAVGLGMIAGVRFVTCYFSTSKKIMSLFLLIVLFICAVTFDGYLTILSGSAACLNTIGSFCKNDMHIREIIFLGTSCWLIHNIVVGSPIAVLLEAVFLFSNLLGYYRFYGKARRNILLFDS